MKSALLGRGLGGVLGTLAGGGGPSVEPTLAGVTFISGGDGGMAPHAIMARANILPGEGSDTGVDGGYWPEGRFWFEVVKDDNSDIDAADIAAMTVTEPTQGFSSRCDQRWIGGAPHAGLVITVPGTYKVRMFYENKKHEVSDWVESTTFVVAASTRTVRHAGAGGNDANDGTSFAQRKLTLNGVASLVAGNNYEISLTGAIDSGAAVDLSSRSGIWIHGDGTAVVTADADYIFKMGNDSVLDNFDIAYDGVTKRAIFATGISKANVAVMNIEYEDVQSFIELGSDRLPTGWFVFGCTQLAKVDRYCVYMDTLTGLEVVGCDFPLGSNAEHTERNNGSFIGVRFSTLDYASDDTNKSAFRCYGQHVGAYRSKLANGTISLGNIDNDATEYRNYSIECCHITFNSNSAAQAVALWNNVGIVVVRSCFLTKTSGSFAAGMISCEDNADGEVRDIATLRFLNLTVRGTGVANLHEFFGTSLGAAHPLIDTEFRGILLAHTDGWGTGQRWRIAEDPDGIQINDCVLSDIGVDEFSVEGVGYDVTEANATSWAGGNITETHTIENDGSVLDGDGDNWKTASAGTDGVFEDYVTGANRTTSHAGCTAEVTAPPPPPTGHADNFNDSDGDIDGRTMSDLIGIWETLLGAAAISGNKASLTGTEAIVADSNFGDVADTRVGFTYKSGAVGAIIRCSADGQDLIAVYCNPTIFLLKRLAGNLSIIGGSTGAAAADGDVIELTGIGTNFKSFKNAVEVHDVTDASIASGMPGIYAQTAGELDDYESEAL